MDHTHTDFHSLPAPARKEMRHSHNLHQVFCNCSSLVFHTDSPLAPLTQNYNNSLHNIFLGHLVSRQFADSHNLHRQNIQIHLLYFSSFLVQDTKQNSPEPHIFYKYVVSCQDFCLLYLFAILSFFLALPFLIICICASYSLTPASFQIFSSCPL